MSRKVHHCCSCWCRYTDATEVSSYKLQKLFFLQCLQCPKPSISNESGQKFKKKSQVLLHLLFQKIKVHLSFLRDYWYKLYSHCTKNCRNAKMVLFYQALKPFLHENKTCFNSVKWRDSQSKRTNCHVTMQIHTHTRVRQHTHAHISNSRVCRTSSCKSPAAFMLMMAQIRFPWYQQGLWLPGSCWLVLRVCRCNVSPVRIVWLLSTPLSTNTAAVCWFKPVGNCSNRPNLGFPNYFL